LYVNDFAGVMDAETIAQIRSVLIALKAQTGVEAVVVTIQSVSDYNTGDETIEAFATGLFNAWGVGSAAKHDGILILAAIRDREIRLEVGSGYDAAMNREMEIALDENILPFFRREDYSGGLYNGVRAVIQAVTGEWPETAGAPQTNGTAVSDDSSVSTTTSQTSTFSVNIPGEFLLGGGALGLGGGYLLYRRWSRYRPHKCPNCGDTMTRLDEASDDLHLESGQKLEEMLASIDYDVWKCQTCGATSVYAYPAMFSRYKDCPKCHHKTLATGERVLDAPTYSSSGRKEVSVDCQNCKYHDDYLVVLPQLVRTSSHSSGSSYRSSSSGSSSRSSFGGGRSSGGGASGKW
jgi:uncharacterized protein